MRHWLRRYFSFLRFICWTIDFILLVSGSNSSQTIKCISKLKRTNCSMVHIWNAKETKLPREVELISWRTLLILLLLYRWNRLRLYANRCPQRKYQEDAISSKKVKACWRVIIYLSTFPGDEFPNVHSFCRNCRLVGRMLVNVLK